MTKELGRVVSTWAWSVTLTLSIVTAWSHAQAQELAPEQAQEPAEDPLVSVFSINDEDPENSVPTPEDANRKPLQMGYHLMNLSERADSATARGDHLAAAKYWRALGKAVPDRSLSYVRACKSLEAAGDLGAAAEECRKALGKEGVTVDDHLRFVQLTLRKPGELSESDIADVDAVASHIREQLANEQGEVAENLVLCQLGSRITDATRLKKCTGRLQALAPSDPQTFVYTWSLAMLERDFDRASKVLDGAEQAKLTNSAVASMRESLRVAREKQSQLASAAPSLAWLYRGLPLLVLAAVLFAIYKFRQRVAQT